MVDDRPTTREILKLVLGRSGYRVSEACDGEEAIRALDGGEFDLVISDLVMPGMTGLDLLGEIRSRFNRSELPVIILTVRDREEDFVAAMRRGANDYVTKPLNHAVLLARIENHLMLRKAVVDLHEEKAKLGARNADLAAANDDLDAVGAALRRQLSDPLQEIRRASAALLEGYGADLGRDGVTHLMRIQAAAESLAAAVDREDTPGEPSGPAG